MSRRSPRRLSRSILRIVAIPPIFAVLASVGITTAPPAVSASGRAKVFAHYFPPYPISIDNRRADVDYYSRNYLRPSGEDGKHTGYGGWLRDRPRGVKPKVRNDWRIVNHRTEIKKAKRARIDGFMIDLLSAHGRNWRNSVNVTRAASRMNDFVVVPMVDATASFADQSPSAAADKIAVLLNHSAAYRTRRGYLLSSFAAERKPVSWWRSVIRRLENRHRMPITFQAVFLNASRANMDAFAPIADGYGNWGTRTVQSVRNAPNYAARAHARGKTWMAPVAMQDYRPRSSTYAETNNTRAFRTMWADARSDDADLVQLVTWNDYSESTQIAPSTAHGNCFVDLTGYYGSWFTDRRRPPIRSDAIFITHRKHRVGATPHYRHRLATPDLGGSDAAPRDTVEVLLFLTRRTTVVVRVGDHRVRYRVDPGIRVRKFQLRTGRPSVQLRRSGQTVLSLRSRQRVVSRPHVQDLQYYASCAKRR